ncbi:MAG: SDR family oxidoreductase [Candidatus Bathyarchaeia archaeon]|jgi:NAD(P)-dependent dehydrogenase (short-subunit alcohol dehydrogenase family)
MSSIYRADLQLSGKVVVVTGAARGIGAAIAKAFGSAKCKVLVADRMRRPDGRARAETIAQEIAKAGGEAFVMQVDVSDQTQVDKMFQTAVEKFGKIDIFVSNAAIMRGGYIWDTDLKNLQEHFDVNVKGSFQCCQAAAKRMIKQGTGGKIVIISSIDGIEGNEAEIAYAMSKASLILLMKCMAVELAQYRINVNAIAPGWVETEMTVPFLNDALLKEVRKRIPLGDMAKPEQIAGGALFLASHLSSFMTGHVMVMDGGQTINQTIKAGETAVQYST